MDQYMSQDPANNFNSSIEWDILSAVTPWQYYVFGPMPNTPPCAMGPVMFDGPTITASSVMLVGGVSRYSYCNYDPTVPPVATAPVSLSVNEEKVEAVYKAYPNPASQILTIEGVQQVSSYTLTDLSGRTIRLGILQPGISRLLINDLPDGFYMIRITDKQGITHTVKFVKAD
jgi:hypothetical protein